LFGGADTADDHINLSQSFDELFLGGLQVAFPDLDAPILETCDGRLLGRDRTDERKARSLVLRSIGGRWAAYKVTGIQQTVGNGASGFTRCANEQNLSLRHG
jgi:hypothetical protein